MTSLLRRRVAIGAVARWAWRGGRLPAALGLWLLGATLAAAASAAPIRLADDRGRAFEFDAPPQRIVSLLPSLTESVCALGACARLVGVDRYSNWPASIDALPRLGGLEDAQVERIVRLRPDVVLAAPSSRVVDRLESLGQRVVVLDAQTHAGVRQALGLLATLLGTPGEGAALWSRIEAEIDAARSRVPARLAGARLYVEVDPGPYAAGAGSFIGETLARLGLGNVVPRSEGPFPKLNPEYVVRQQPEVVVGLDEAVAEMPRRPGWAALAALRSGQVCAYPRLVFDVLIRPGPRMGEAASRLAECLVALPDAGGSAR